MEVLHAHVIAVVITDFRCNLLFAALEQYMRSHWVPMHDCSGFLTEVGHRVLSILRTPTSDTPPTPTAVGLPSKSGSSLRYGASFMMIIGYSVLLQLTANHSWCTQDLEGLEPFISSTSMIIVKASCRSTCIVLKLFF